MSMAEGGSDLDSVVLHTEYETAEIAEDEKLLSTLGSSTKCLDKMQYSVAKLFEIIYCSVIKLPSISKKIRLSSTMARRSHMDALDLIKTYAVKANQIVKSVIPCIIRAIDTQDTGLAQRSLDSMIELVKDMEHRTKEVKKSYDALTEAFQVDIGLIMEKCSQMKEQKDDIEKRRRAAEKRKKNFEELAAKRKSKENEYREKLKELEDDLKKSKNEMSTHVKETKLSLLAAFVPILGRRYEEYKRRVDNDSFSKIKETANVHEETIRQTDKKREEVSKQEEEANEKAQEQFLLLQELDIETELLEVASLDQTLMQRVYAVDQNLFTMSNIWGVMTMRLEFLRNAAWVGQPQIRSINREEWAESLKQIMNGVKDKWVDFGRIFSHYVHHCERDPKHSIETLYDFLHGRVEAMSDEQQAKNLEMLHKEFNQSERQETGQWAECLQT